MTIDGPAGSGKSTVALIVARTLGLRYLNSGALYRAVTLLFVESGDDFEDRKTVASRVAEMVLEVGDSREGARYSLNGRDVTDRLKDPDVTKQVYRIANVPEYRTLLTESQRSYATGDGLVAEGRDMGTVIFPEAGVKIFIDAPAEVRAIRQHKELLERGVDASLSEVLARIEERDRHDRFRDTAPLVAAPDSVCIDSGCKSIADVVDSVYRAIVRRCRDGTACRYSALFANVSGFEP